MPESGYSGVVPFVMHQEEAAGESWQGTFSHHLFSITLQGGADYQFPDGAKRIEAGDFLHFAPGAWQDWTAFSPTGWTVYYIITDLPPRLLDILPQDNLAPGIGQVRLGKAESALVAEAFDRMVTWGEGHSMMSERLILNQLDYVLLEIRNRHPLRKLDGRVERARHFLHGRVGRDTRLAEAAEAAGLSKPRLCALFKEALGVSPLHYLENLRMERAAQMLLFTSRDIDTIAVTLTYYDRKYFDKRFKRRWGVTPFRYRLQNK
ncbi:MAG: helix-turn-helix domain-containing protein [Lentisphaeria bacterium]|nr:helix-turn-helix domain-containing protein [Lentisphaeria bacterium]